MNIVYRFGENVGESGMLRQEKKPMHFFDNVLLEQAGIQVTHPMTNRAVMKVRN